MPARPGRHLAAPPSAASSPRLGGRVAQGARLLAAERRALPSPAARVLVALEQGPYHRAVAEPDAYRALVEAVAAEHRVRLAYAFGSAAREASGPLSDVDLALLLDRPPTWDEERRLRARLAAVDPRVDLVILNRAPPALRYEVLTGGRCLLARDEAEQAEFEITSLSRFLDLQPFRRVQREYLRERVERRLGASRRSAS